LSERDDFTEHPATLAQYLAILRRRKWIIIGLPVLAAVFAYVLSASQAAVYRAKAEVYFNRSGAAQISTDTPDPALGDPTRFMDNQASLATTPELARQVVEAAGIKGLDAGTFLSRASAEPAKDQDILGLSVTSPNSSEALALTNAYANQFTVYKTKLDRGAITDALRTVNLKIQKLEDQGKTGTDRYDLLVQKQDELQTDGELVAKNARVIRPASGAEKTQPTPRRDAMLGALLGAFVGLGLAFLFEAVDKRVRTEQEIGDVLGLPLLARIPRPARRLEQTHSLVMRAEPDNLDAQAFRRLRTALEFVNFEHGAQMIMVTSALPREGKTTSVANLAVALARAGRRVGLVDLDLRRPLLHKFFETGSDHGFTDVVVHRLGLERALRSVVLARRGSLARSPNNGQPPAGDAPASNGQANVDCFLNVLPAGTIPPAADEFLETAGIDEALQELRRRFDIVLVDTPPLLAVGDVMALSTKVDAIVVVTRLGILRKQLQELARQLQTCRAPVLGFILTGASRGDSYSYGYYPLGYTAQEEPELSRERT
jgi:Mrp family chromosome partitioning ATPase/capsular polysaccharide biosynthesis protein